VAAQAHSSKEDRAVVISARNFIRAFGGSVGLAIASAIFSNTLLRGLPSDIPPAFRHQVEDSIFDMPNASTLSIKDKNSVRDAYVHASKSIFYLWFAAITVCLILMVFIKDKGLKRIEEEIFPEESREGPMVDVVSEKMANDGQQQVV
jgi:hypothetical protein